MAENDTLLAYLSSWFTSQTENIAVEALGYVLKSPPAREGLDDAIRSGVQKVNPISSVRTQAIGWEDGTRPDLVGVDESDVERVLIEAKFWAGLTSRQPTAYLDRLPEYGPSVLMFVAPEERIKSLWPELQGRATAQGKKFGEVHSERKCLRVEGTERHLMIISWTGLMDRLAARAREAGETDVEKDIQQLRGLAEFADDGRFQPIRESGEDFGPDSRRMRDLKHIIDSATERGIAGGWASKKGLNRTPRSYGYGRYLWLGSMGVWFGVNVQKFEETAETPLWVAINPGRNRMANVLAELGLSDYWIPVHLPRGVEYPDALDGVVESLRQTAEKLQAVTA